MKMNKLVLISLLAGCIFSTAGCNLLDDSEEKIDVDTSKTQLYVGYFDAGVGRDWIKKLSANFEDAYADYSFEEGKKGVQVIIDYDRVGLGGENLFGTIGSKKQTVFVTENIEYYKFASQGKLYNLDNVLNNKDDHYKDEKTIAQKMDKEMQDYFSMLNGNYYAIPYYEGLMGFQYDVDLFEAKKLFFKMQDDGKPVTANALDDFFDPAEYFVTSLTEERSYGPDGKTGVVDGIDYTLDDGLPATFNEFYALEKQMVSVGVTPFMWCTNYLGYMVDEMVALCADIEGKEQFDLAYTWGLNGNNVAKNLISVANDGTVTSLGNTTISPSNANLLQKSKGRYYALQFAKNIVADESYYVPNIGLTHTQAQKNFINTGHVFSKDVAMLMDGNWWEVEGSANFSTTNAAESRLTRKFGLMPFPKIDVETWEAQKGNTYFTENMCMMFMNANTPENMVDCSERYLRFINQDSQMSIFTQTTSMMRPFDYVMSAEDLANTSYYGRQLYNIRRNILNPNCNDSLVNYYPKNVTVAKNETTVHKDNWYFSNSDGDTNPINVFIADNNKSPIDYFNKIYTKYSNWNPSL